MNYRNPKLTALARRQPCMLRVPGVCNNDPATTVWCHSNRQADGRGFNYKSHDCFGCFGCSACHHWLDHGKASKQEKDERFELGFRMTLLYCWQNNLFLAVGAKAT